jgi:cyclophilin family peptidyl-prolyl cis-trans isomerase
VRSQFPASFECLEARHLLSAAVIARIPTQTIAVGQASETIDLTADIRDSAVPSGDTVVDMATNLKAPYNSIPIELTDAATPKTVANFLQYVDSGAYANTIIHRSVPDFIIQGGGYTTDGAQIDQFAAVPSEAATETLTNVEGTIAMAQPAGGAGTATSQWFFNLADNTVLDGTEDGGPFTVFGKVLYKGLDTLNDIANLPIVNDEANIAWSTLPVQSGTNGATVPSVAADDLVIVKPVVVPGGVNYSVASSDPSIASATVTDGVLSFSAVNPGTTKITVTGTDLGGKRVTSTFALDVTGTATATALSDSIAGSTLPAQGIVGQPFKGKVTVNATNQSGTTAKGSVTVDVYASDDGSIDGSSVLLGSQARNNVSISAGKTVPFVVSVKQLPAGLSVGSYTILARSVEGTQGLGTVATGASLGVVPPEIDLSDRLVSVPSSGVIGRSISVTLDVSNSGNILASGPLQVAFAASPTPDGADAFALGTVSTHISLKPGVTHPAHLSIRLPAGVVAGSEYLVATVDPGDLYADVDLSNNTAVSATPFTAS